MLTMIDKSPQKPRQTAEEMAPLVKIMIQMLLVFLSCFPEAFLNDVLKTLHLFNRKISDLSSKFEPLSPLEPKPVNGQPVREGLVNLVKYRYPS